MTHTCQTSTKLKVIKRESWDGKNLGMSAKLEECESWIARNSGEYCTCFPFCIRKATTDKKSVSHNLLTIILLVLTALWFKVVCMLLFDVFAYITSGCENYLWQVWLCVEGRGWAKRKNSKWKWGQECTTVAAVCKPCNLHTKLFTNFLKVDTITIITIWEKTVAINILQRGKKGSTKALFINL